MYVQSSISELNTKDKEMITLYFKRIQESSIIITNYNIFGQSCTFNQLSPLGYLLRHIESALEVSFKSFKFSVFSPVLSKSIDINLIDIIEEPISTLFSNNNSTTKIQFDYKKEEKKLKEQKIEPKRSAKNFIKIDSKVFIDTNEEDISFQNEPEFIQESNKIFLHFYTFEDFISFFNINDLSQKLKNYNILHIIFDINDMNQKVSFQKLITVLIRFQKTLKSMIMLKLTFKCCLDQSPDYQKDSKKINKLNLVSLAFIDRLCTLSSSTTLRNIDYFILQFKLKEKLVLKVKYMKFNSNKNIQLFMHIIQKHDIYSLTMTQTIVEILDSIDHNLFTYFNITWNNIISLKTYDSKTNEESQSYLYALHTIKMEDSPLVYIKMINKFSSGLGNIQKILIDSQSIINNNEKIIKSLSFIKEEVHLECCFDNEKLNKLDAKDYFFPSKVDSIKFINSDALSLDTLLHNSLQLMLFQVKKISFEGCTTTFIDLCLHNSYKEKTKIPCLAILEFINCEQVRLDNHFDFKDLTNLQQLIINDTCLIIEEDKKNKCQILTKSLKVCYNLIEEIAEIKKYILEDSYKSIHYLSTVLYAGKIYLKKICLEGKAFRLLKQSNQYLQEKDQNTKSVLFKILNKDTNETNQINDSSKINKTDESNELENTYEIDDTTYDTNETSKTNDTYLPQCRYSKNDMKNICF